MDGRPLVSVIVPVYNVERFLPECLDSLIAQTYQELEIILVNDGSTDNSGAICEAYSKNDSRIIVIKKENQGLFAARRDGCRIAKGEYIGFVDSDDWIEPRMYEDMLKKCISEKVDVVLSGIIDNSDSDEKRRLPYFEQGRYTGDTFDDIIVPKMIYTGEYYQYGIEPYLCNKLFRASAVLPFQNVPSDVGIEFFNDSMVSWPTILVSKKIYIMADCYYHYRVRHDSKKRRKVVGIENIVKSVYSEWVERLVNGIDKTKADAVERQFRWFAVYNIVSKDPSIFDHDEQKCVLNAYGGIPHGSKVVIYGASMVGMNIERYISELPSIEVVMWADRSWKSFGKEYGISDPKRIAGVEFDYIILGIARNSMIQSAAEDLDKLGVKPEKIRIIDMHLLQTYYDKFLV